MSTLRRWCAVAVGVALFAGALAGWSHRPVVDADVSAQTLLHRVRAAERTPYSGLVHTTGTLALPVTSRFSDLAELFGQSTTLRVWWRDRGDYRVDRLLPTGESDVIRERTVTTQWSYERSRAAESQDPLIRLPRTDDILPTSVARRLLEDARDDEASRLPARRVAGRTALGLRVSPRAPQASVDHVDLWIDEESSVPLRVEVYGDARLVAFTSSFVEFDASRPAAALTSFTAPPGADVDVDDVVDVADAADQFADVVPPDQLSGLPRTDRSDRAVGVYGRGITEIIALPLWYRVAGPLRAQLATTPGVTPTATGDALRVGPLGLMLTGEGDDGGWLVVGSVDDGALAEAATQLLAGQQPRDDDGGRP